MLVIEFAVQTVLHREQDRPSSLPIYRNGPPGTFVLFPDGLRVSLPTDQIVRVSDDDGQVRAEFGGMTFVGEIDGQLTFRRVRELHDEQALSPDRSHTMRLDPRWVSVIHEGGRLVWPVTQ